MSKTLISKMDPKSLNKTVTKVEKKNTSKLIYYLLKYAGVMN